MGLYLSIKVCRLQLQTFHNSQGSFSRLELLINYSKQELGFFVSLSLAKPFPYQKIHSLYLRLLRDLFLVNVMNGLERKANKSRLQFMKRDLSQSEYIFANRNFAMYNLHAAKLHYERNKVHLLYLCHKVCQFRYPQIRGRKFGQTYIFLQVGAIFHNVNRNNLIFF